jgi:hypothetical protein
MLVDQSGNKYEIRLPFVFSGANERRRSEWIVAKGAEDHTISDWRHIWDWQRREDEWLELCKQKLLTIPKEDRDPWPEEGRKSFAGLSRMRAGGLRRLARLLNENGIEDKFTQILAEWREKADLFRRRIRGAQLNAFAHRDDHYRKLADWLARSFSIISWEGNLELKVMAEEVTGEYAIENAKKYRVLASLHLLRSYIRQAMAKHGRKLLNCGAAYSTRICVVCGGHIETGSKLLLRCDNGHQNDQDVNAATYFCSQIEAPANTESDAAGISPELQRYLRRLD